MKELYELKDKVYDELKNYGKKDLSASTLNTVKDLTKTAYYLCELIEEEEEGYSGRARRDNYRGSYENRGNYENRANYESRARRRNSYGRSYDGYSNDGDMMENLRYMMEESPDERTKQEFKRFIQKLEGM